MENNSPKKVVINALLNAIDSLETASSVLERKDALKWKWFAFSLHHSLYQFCCKAIHNGNYENLLKYGYKTDEGYFLKKGNSNKWLKLHKKKIKNGHPAYLIEWKKTDDELPVKRNLKKKNKREKLIGFWSALARVQDPIYWMGRISNTKSITLSSDEWDNVIWLSEIRNKIQHFIPKTYILVEEDFIEPGIALTNIIERLVFETHTIQCPKQYKDRIQNSLRSLQNKLNA